MLTKRQQAAKKAVQTRKRNLKKEFLQRFGEDALDVVRTLNRGKKVNWLDTPNAAAYKANLTRGTYDRYMSIL